MGSVSGRPASPRAAAAQAAAAPVVAEASLRLPTAGSNAAPGVRRSGSDAIALAAADIMPTLMRRARAALAP
jgi:hypothetical protein